MRDFAPSATLATGLLSHSLDPIEYDVVSEEDLWQMCDYAWLTNSARRPSVSKGTPTTPMLDFLAATPEPVVQQVAVVDSPDFDTLIGAALNFDFSMLNHVNGHTCANTVYDL